MLYEEYAKKVRRWAQIRDNILRYKVPILCTIAAILAAWAGFLITKGTFTKQIEGDDRYVYGNKLSFEAKALFSSVTYEYNCDGKWTENTPVLPGEYQVRAVAERSFGRTNYSESFAFVIDKRDVTIKVAQSSVEWLELPELKADGLLKGDSFEGAVAELDRSGLGIKTVDIDVSDTVIYNRDGDNVTVAYNISSASSDIDVIPRGITVRLDDVEKIYDGTPIIGEGYSVTKGSLADGHSLNVAIDVDELWHVGTTALRASSATVTADGTDYTGNYNISFLEGTARIIPKEMTLETNSDSKIYDGESFFSTRTVTVNGKLSADTLNVSGWNNPVDVGTYENLPSYTVTTVRDGVSIDVTDNYSVVGNYGVLTITPVKLQVNVKNIEKTYDGIAVYMLEQGIHYTYRVTSAGNLRGNSELTVRLDSPVVNATRGMASFTAVADVVYNQKENITRNYDITIVYEMDEQGYIYITPYQVDIDIFNISKVYDGISVSPVYSIWDSQTQELKDMLNGLGQSLQINTDATYVNAGDYRYTLSCKVLEGKNDVSYNYYFNVHGTTDYVYSSISISKRPLVYETGSITTEYDGNTHYDHTVYVLNDGTYSGFAPDHYAVATSYAQITEVYVVGGSVRGKTNHITFKIIDSQEKDVTANYEIVCDREGTLTITPRAINVVSVFANKYYDGSPMSGTDRASADRLLSGDTVLVYASSAPINVKRGPLGEVLYYENVIEFVIRNYNGVNVSNNYDWGDKGYGGSLTYGELTIIPRPLYITSDSVSKVYDRTPLSGTVNGKGYTIGNSYGLVATHRLEESAFSVTGSKISVGSTSNTITVNVDPSLLVGIVFDSTNADMTYNYDVIFREGYIRIDPITITITPDFVGAVYDGESHSAKNGRLTQGKLLSGDSVWFVSSQGSLTDVGESSSSVYAVVVQDEFGVCVWSAHMGLNHYVFEDPTLPMYVRIRSDSSECLRIYSDGRVEILEDSYGRSNYLWYYTDRDGEQSDECCYSISLGKGKIQIRPRKITIVCDSITESYDHVKKLTGTWRLGSGEMVSGHTLIAAVKGVVTQRGETVASTIDLNSLCVRGKGGEEYTANYEFVIIDGTLSLV